MDHLDAWLQRKKASPTFGLKQACVVTYVHKKHLGPRSEFAGVTLSFKPAEVFGFSSTATWPEAEFAPAFNDSVLDGILDELYASRVSPFASRLEIILKAISWHEIDSSQAAFYKAARAAVHQGLFIECGYNLADWRPGAG